MIQKSLKIQFSASAKSKVHTITSPNQAFTCVQKLSSANWWRKGISISKRSAANIPFIAPSKMKIDEINACSATKNNQECLVNSVFLILEFWRFLHAIVFMSFCLLHIILILLLVFSHCRSYSMCLRSLIPQQFFKYNMSPFLNSDITIAVFISWKTFSSQYSLFKNFSNLLLNSALACLYHSPGMPCSPI